MGYIRSLTTNSVYRVVESPDFTGDTVTFAKRDGTPMLSMWANPPEPITFTLFGRKIYATRAEALKDA